VGDIKEVMNWQREKLRAKGRKDKNMERRNKNRYMIKRKQVFEY
jgi:hypothetical protein